MPSETFILESGLMLTLDLAGKDSPAATAPILLLPAMGTPASYYDTFTDTLLALGHDVVRVHWRDEDRHFPRRHPDHGYAEVTEREVPDAAAFTRARLGSDPIVIGHSLGGQIAPLSAAAGGPYRGIVLLASGTNYWRGSGVLWALWLAFICCAFMPLAVRVFGFWPGGRFGFGGRQSKQMMLDWARLGRSGKFLPRGARIDHEAALAELELPVLALSVAGDIYVSRGAFDHLVGKLARCQVDREHWSASAHAHRGHFNWTKTSHGPAPLIHDWIAGNT